ncbi:unnamed protein product [Cuscuta campestris]|uniref:Uncharacterized protein n=1 Tax=Cuscuta campestris TaxID=132261 RepID=A0A484MZH5_9ASTE|nr:unnamed protein product [Cuscuta campestris]
MAIPSAASASFFSKPRALHPSPPKLLARRVAAIYPDVARSASISASSNGRTLNPNHRTFLLLSFAGGGGDGGTNGGEFPGGGGGDRHGDGESGGHSSNNRKEALMALAESGRSLESLPGDLKAAIENGRIPRSIVLRYLELEKSAWLGWLLRFGGFKERLLADDLFLAKVAMECCVGIFTKTAAEYERRRENFFNELEIVFADVVALPGTSFSLLQRFGAIARNGAKLFAVGTTSSMVGTLVTNALINARKTVDKASAGEVENVPVLSTSFAYGVYMAVSSNLRYQVLAGVIEQRMLEPLLHQHKLALSALCFAVRTGNTFLGSLLWVDYARWIGIQKADETER